MDAILRVQAARPPPVPSDGAGVAAAAPGGDGAASAAPGGAAAASAAAAAATAADRKAAEWTGDAPAKGCCGACAVA